MSFDQSFGQNINNISINACDQCVFDIQEETAFYDDGGYEGPVSNRAQTTTFRSDFRRGKKLSLYFTNLDLPEGAYLEIFSKNAGDSARTEVFNFLEKRANIIADEIRVVYHPAENPANAKGWQAVIEVFEPFNEQVANRPESDCPFAIPLCANQTVVALGGLYTNLGNINDDSGSCYSAGTGTSTGGGGSVWYSFTPLTSGPLDFRILPNSTADYDFVLWDITNGCGSGQRQELSCNYSLYTGSTGMSGSLCNENIGDGCGCTSQSKGADCNRFNNRVNVQVGRKYALSINFFSGSNGGFTLQFQNEAGSVAITDNQAPQVATAFTAQCGSASQFTIRFTEFVQCSSVSNASFALPGYTFNITNLNCFDNRTNTINFTVSPPLPAGTYNVQINDIRDLCNNSLNANYLIDLSNPPTPSITSPVPVCRNPNPNGTFSTQPAQTLTASGGNTYEWSTGQTGASINVNPASTTTYTVTAFRGSCAASATATVEVRRAAAITLGPDIVTCGIPVTLTATPNIPGYNYQFFRGPATGPILFNNGTSIQNGPNNTITVNPTNNTRYRVIVTDNNGCRAQADIFVRVSSDLNATILVDGNNFCTNANPIPLNANPPGGTFSGPGVVGNQFFPNLAGVGDHEIVYEFTNPCGTYTGTRSIRVSNGTLPNINLAPTYCVTDPAFNFNPTPRCGQARGPGITVQGACLFGNWAQQPRFDPSLAGIGTHTITYTGAGCGNTTTVTVLPNEAAPQLDDIGGPFCSNESPVPLSAFPSGGTFSGPGVSGDIFDPAVAGVGSHIITYTIITCSGPASDFKQVLVAAGNASATISYSGLPYCASDAASKTPVITGSQGGTFSSSPAGLSINAATGVINPAASTPGNYTVTYSIAGAGGCSSFSTTASVAITAAQTPLFAPFAPFCAGASAPALPSSSTNGINGSWTPAVINNTVSGSYTFTPAAGQCASATTIDVQVNAAVAPVFDPVPPICAGAIAPVLPAISNNGISGNWLPAVVDNTSSGTYTFTPDAGQCASATTLDVTVTSNILPLFDAIAPICSGAAVPALPLVSNNGISGTWLPAVIDNTISATYTFSPAAGQCAVSATLDITVTNGVQPVFDALDAICSGAAAPVLPAVSNNAISGTWSPATINNSSSATYIFSPNAGQCAVAASLDFVVNELPVITVDTPPGLCEGASVSLTANGASSYEWSPATGLSAITGATVTASPDVTTTYTVTGIDANGCKGTTDVTVTIFAEPDTSPIFKN